MEEVHRRAVLFGNGSCFWFTFRDVMITWLAKAPCARLIREKLGESWQKARIMAPPRGFEPLFPA